MIDELLDPIGIDNPAQMMAAFQNAGNEMLVNLRQKATSPNDKKIPRTWGTVNAAELIGVSTPTLRKLDCEKNETQRRIYTLKTINELRDKFGTRYCRPPSSNPMVLPVLNFKGGCAKTTTAVHLAQKAALEGLRVLLIDFDPQGTATFVSTGIIPDLELNYEDTIESTLMDNPEDIKRIIKPTHFDGLDIVPGNLALQDCELGLPNMAINNSQALGSPVYRLQKALSIVQNNYDLIVIDCGPNLGILTINAIAAANGMLIPIPPNMFDYASFVMLTGTLTNLFESIKPKFDFFRILLSKHSGSGEATKVENMMRRQFSGYVLSNHMCETIEIAKATNDLNSIYDISKPRGSRDAYRRALQYLDSVNMEILSLFKDVWKTQDQLNKRDGNHG